MKEMMLAAPVFLPLAGGAALLAVKPESEGQPGIVPALWKPDREVSNGSYGKRFFGSYWLFMASGNPVCF